MMQSIFQNFVCDHNLRLWERHLMPWKWSSHLNELVGLLRKKVEGSCLMLCHVSHDFVFGTRLDFYYLWLFHFFVCFGQSSVIVVFLNLPLRNSFVDVTAIGWDWTQTDWILIIRVTVVCLCLFFGQLPEAFEEIFVSLFGSFPLFDILWVIVVHCFQFLQISLVNWDWLFLSLFLRCFFLFFCGVCWLRNKVWWSWMHHFEEFIV